MEVFFFRRVPPLRHLRPRGDPGARLDHSHPGVRGPRPLDRLIASSCTRPRKIIATSIYVYFYALSPFYDLWIRTERRKIGDERPFISLRRCEEVPAEQSYTYIRKTSKFTTIPQIGYQYFTNRTRKAFSRVNLVPALLPSSYPHYGACRLRREVYQLAQAEEREPCEQP